MSGQPISNGRREPNWSSRGPRLTGAAEDWLSRVLDGALVAIIFVAPFFMGGRHPLGRFVLVLLIVVAAVAWFARQCLSTSARWTRSGGEWIILAGALVVLVQIVPLPPSLLDALAPHRGELLSLWTAEANASAGLGTWSQVSLVPEATRGGLVLFLAYGLLFVVVVQRMRNMTDVETMLRWVGLSAVIMAAFGLVQYLASNGKFLWIYEHPFRTTDDHVKGSFINRNHFTHMLALGIGPLAMWMVTSLRRDEEGGSRGFAGRRPISATTQLAVAALVIVLFAGLISLSRGGAMAMAIALSVSALLFYRAGLMSRKYFLGLTGIVALVAASLAVHGYEQVFRRLNDFTAGSLEALDSGGGRRKIWQANVDALRDNLLLGTGVGTHPEIYPMYHPDVLPVELTHAESGFLQVASETGLAGLLLLSAGIGLCFWWCASAWSHARSKNVQAALAAVAAGLAASAVHSVVDFVWYIPACMSLTVILAACAFRLRSFSAPPDSKSCVEVSARQPVWIALTGLLVVVGGWMACDRFGSAAASVHWDSYLRASVAAVGLAQSKAPEFPTSLELSDDPQSTAMAQMMASHLENVVLWDSSHARGHIRLAGLYLQRFDQLQQESDNVINLTQIRDAAIASQFRSRDELNAWLARAIGDHAQLLDRALWHVRRGLRCCPLQGEGYLYLAELCFLEGGHSATKKAYMTQALHVRPHDGNVLFEAGKEAILTSDVDQAIEYWKWCFQNSESHQIKIINLLASRVPIEFFLENFDPDLRALNTLGTRYRRLASPEQFTAYLQFYARKVEEKAGAEQGERAGEIWSDAIRTYQQLGDEPRAEQSARRAAALAPHSFRVRYAIANWLFDRGRFAEAEEHFQWCSRRKPTDQQLQEKLEAAVKGRIDGKQQTASAAPPDGRGARF